MRKSLSLMLHKLAFIIIAASLFVSAIWFHYCNVPFVIKPFSLVFLSERKSSAVKLGERKFAEKHGENCNRTYTKYLWLPLIGFVGLNSCPKQSWIFCAIFCRMIQEKYLNGITDNIRDLDLIRCELTCWQTFSSIIRNFCLVTRLFYNPFRQVAC